MGDGANDLPMMGVAGLSVAYHAKPKVREQAMVAINDGGLDRLLGCPALPLTPAGQTPGRLARRRPACELLPQRHLPHVPLPPPERRGLARAGLRALAW